MSRNESLQDYMQGFLVGLSGGGGRDGDVTSVRSWTDGFKAGRATREKAERTASLEYVGLQSIRVDRHDLLA